MELNKIYGKEMMLINVTELLILIAVVSKTLESSSMVSPAAWHRVLA